jgi:hypothetical protein
MKQLVLLIILFLITTCSSPSLTAQHSDSNLPISLFNEVDFSIKSSGKVLGDTLILRPDFEILAALFTPKLENLRLFLPMLDTSSVILQLHQHSILSDNPTILLGTNSGDIKKDPHHVFDQG